MEGHFAFIGIGAMGYGMASNLRKKLPPASKLAICDPNETACKCFQEEMQSFGPIEIVRTAKEAALDCDTIISMVPSPDHARQVHLDPVSGTIAAPANDTRLVLDCSTLDTESTKTIGSTLRESGVCGYVDAPVAVCDGNVQRSAKGLLTFMVGCEKPNGDGTPKRIFEILSMMGDPAKIFFCGRLGAGAAAKIADNYLSGTFLVAISEAMATGIRSGVDPQTLWDVIHNGAGQSYMGDLQQPVPGLVASAPSSRDYAPDFRHELMIKDLKFGISAARQAGVEPAVAEVALEVFQRAAKDPKTAGKDYTSVYRLINPDA